MEACLNPSSSSFLHPTHPPPSLRVSQHSSSVRLPHVNQPHNSLRGLSGNLFAAYASLFAWEVCAGWQNHKNWCFGSWKHKRAGPPSSAVLDEHQLLFRELERLIGYKTELVSPPSGWCRCSSTGGFFLFRLISADFGKSGISDRWCQDAVGTFRRSGPLCL